MLSFVHYTNKNILDDVYLHAVISSEKINKNGYYKIT